MTGFSKEVRTIVTFRSGDRCEVMARCQGRIATAWGAHHHRRPRGMGSSRRPETNQAANALAVCYDCHNFIESHRELGLRNGWLVRQNQTPAQIPVLYRHRWCLLSDDGSVVEAKCICGEVTDSGWYPGVCVCVEEN